MVSSSLNSVGGGIGGRGRQDSGSNLLQELEALSQALYKASQAQNVITGEPAGPSPSKDHNPGQQRQDPRSPGSQTRRGTIPSRGSYDAYGKTIPYSMDTGNSSFTKPSSHPARHLSMSAATPSTSLYPEQQRGNTFQVPSNSRHSIGVPRTTFEPSSAQPDEDSVQSEAPAAQPPPERKLRSWHSQGFDKTAGEEANFPEWLEDNINFSRKLESAPEKKKGFWNWKPFRSLSHIGHTRYNCLFSLHVHAIESLPQAMNGLRLTVDWRHKDRSVQTTPARAFQNSAEFEETLRLRCSVYSSKSAHHAIKFMPKEFVLCIIALDVDELILGQHYLDLSRLLPEAPDREQEDEDKPLSWTTSFKLSGKAKGATLVVTFGYELLTKEKGDKSGRYGNAIGSQSPAIHSPSLRSFAGGSYSTHGTPRPRPADGSNMFFSPTVSEPGDYFDRMAMEHLNLDDGAQPENPGGSSGIGEIGRRRSYGMQTSAQQQPKVPVPAFPQAESRLRASTGAGQAQEQWQQAEPTLAPLTPRQTEKPPEPAVETSPSSTHDLSSSPSSSYTQREAGEKGDSDDEPEEFIVVDQGVEVGTLPESIQYSKHNLDDQDSVNLESPVRTVNKSPASPLSVERNWAVGGATRSPSSSPNLGRRSPLGGSVKSPVGLPPLDRRSSLGSSKSPTTTSPNLERRLSLGSVTKSPTTPPGGLERRLSLGGSSKLSDAAVSLERRLSLGTDFAGTSKSPESPLGYGVEGGSSLASGFIGTKSPEAPLGLGLGLGLGLERGGSLGSDFKPLGSPLNLERKFSLDRGSSLDRKSSLERKSSLSGSGKLLEVPLPLERKRSAGRSTVASLDEIRSLEEEEPRLDAKDRSAVLEAVQEEDIQDKYSDSAPSPESQEEPEVIKTVDEDDGDEEEDRFEDAVEEIRQHDTSAKSQVAEEDPRPETEVLNNTVEKAFKPEEEVVSTYEEVDDNVQEKHEDAQEFWDPSDGVVDQELSKSVTEEDDKAVGPETVIWETPLSPPSPVPPVSPVSPVSPSVEDKPTAGPVAENSGVESAYSDSVPDVVEDHPVPEVVEVDSVPEVVEVHPVPEAHEVEPEPRIVEVDSVPHISKVGSAQNLGEDLGPNVFDEAELKQPEEDSGEMQSKSGASLFSDEALLSAEFGNAEDHERNGDMMDDLDNEVDLIAGDFLSMLEGGDRGGGVMGMSSDSENDSPRALLLRQFEQEAFLEGGVGLKLGTPDIAELNLDSSPDRSDAQQPSESSLDQSDASGQGWPSGEDEELASIMEAAESELQKATQTMRSKTRAKMLEDAETEALMQEWGLNEKSFENSPPNPSAGFMDMIGNQMVKTPSDPPTLGQGLGAIVQTKDGGMLRSMNPAHFSQGRAGGKLVMQVSKPVVVPAEMGTGGLDIFRRLASAGVENMALQAMVAMPLEDITGKSVHQVDYESKAALEGPSSNQHYLPGNGGGNFNLATSSSGARSISGTTRATRGTSRGVFESSSRAEPSDEFVSLEELAPMAMQKMEALAMDGLKIQADMTDESAPYSVDALPWAGTEQNSKFGRGSGIGSLDGVAAMHLLDAKALGDNVNVEADGLMSKSISIDEWMRLDAGQYDENDTTDETMAILAAHGAVNKDLVGRKSKEDRIRYMQGAKASANFGKGGFMGNTLTIAILVQLRDPLRNNEAVGAPMMALVQAERVIVPPRPKLPRRAPSLLGSSITWDDDEEAPEPSKEETQPQFKITALHMSGLKPSEEQAKEEPKATKKGWGTQKQQQSGSRWLSANGMGKTGGPKLSALKDKPMSGGSKTGSEKSSESLWSISSKTQGAGSKWKGFGGSSPSMRNPDVKFSSSKLRAR